MPGIHSAGNPRRFLVKWYQNFNQFSIILIKNTKEKGIFELWNIVILIFVYCNVNKLLLPLAITYLKVKNHYAEWVIFNDNFYLLVLIKKMGCAVYIILMFFKKINHFFFKLLGYASENVGILANKVHNICIKWNGLFLESRHWWRSWTEQEKQ